MGYWVAPGARNHPDPDEYVRIREDQLRERNGRFEIRVTNELEEALYVDRLQLIEVAHPAGQEVFPDEGLVGPPFKPFKLYATANARPPVAAIDDKGRDVLSRITELDRQYVEGFALHSNSRLRRQSTRSRSIWAARPPSEHCCCSRAGPITLFRATTSRLIKRG